VGAAGVVALGLGVVFGLNAKSDRDDAKPNCNGDQSICNAQGAEDMRRARDAATASTIAILAGGVLAATGAVLFFTAPRGAGVRLGAISSGYGLIFARAW
jgi:hypothetical protein